MPKFTVITPTYNRADLLPKTIESVLAQSEIDFEYLIIDDGSTDQTESVVKQYLSDPRVKYRYKENGGEPSAVNLGWRLAKGEYFLQINSDDPVMPQLLKVMGEELDSHPEAILAYSDFQFIDELDKPIQVIHSPAWDFLAQLRQFSCVAAAPATTFRRASLAHWKELRNCQFRYINDVEMYWAMALDGPFLHVSQVLSSWRVHSQQISHHRYLALPEVAKWYKDYFSMPNLPKDVANCKEACKQSIHQYARSLVLQSDITTAQKREILFDFEKDIMLDGKQYICVQIGDNDLVGNKFNGHDLQILLNKHGIQAYHLVRQRYSKDQQTIQIPVTAETGFAEQIIHRKEYQLSDIVHMHLIHNTNFDVNMLPLMSSLKPTLLTLHDPYFLGGHCIHSGDCEKFKTICVDCPHLEIPFALPVDISALEFERKRQAFQNSNISLIVASKWMEDRAKESPVFAGKKIYRLAFGIDQQLFKPADAALAKQKLGIQPDALVLMLRADASPFKGLETLQKALDEISYASKITLIVVGQNGLLEKYKKSYTLREFGWLKDDFRLAELYQACDIFLMPSTQEAFGMMAIEAMSCGKPVLALNGTALPSVINSPQCGLAVDKEEYSATLQAWIDDAEERRKRGKASLDYALQCYSHERYIDGMLNIYDDVMRHFVPSINQYTILSQLNYVTELNENISSMLRTDCQSGYTELERINHNSTPLFYSRSWEMTKPIRAFQNARKFERGFLRRVKYYRRYMKDAQQDKQSDAEILRSHCWRITAPLRKLARPFKKNRS